MINLESSFEQIMIGPNIRFKVIGHLVLGKKGFYHIWTWQQFWFYDPDTGTILRKMFVPPTNGCSTKKGFESGFGEYL